MARIRLIDEGAHSCFPAAPPWHRPPHQEVRIARRAGPIHHLAPLIPFGSRGALSGSCGISSDLALRRPTTEPAMVNHRSAAREDGDGRLVGSWHQAASDERPLRRGQPARYLPPGQVEYRLDLDFHAGDGEGGDLDQGARRPHIAEILLAHRVDRRTACRPGSPGAFSRS
jgi:hypothetical protein